MNAIAVHHVVTRPEDAPVVVLSNSLGSTTSMGDGQADALAEHFCVGRDDTRGHGGSPVPAGPYDIKAASDAIVAATPAAGYASCCEVIANMDLRGDMPGILAPTLAIAGADDPAAPPPFIRTITEDVKDGRLLVVLESANLVNAEQPEIITPAIIAHLTEHA